MPETLRKDAARNRERLLVAARELLAAGEADLALNDVARRAGVGVGTAYRRFASREELVEALFGEALDAMEAVAREELARADPWEAVVGFLERTLELQFGDQGLDALLHHPALGAERAAQARDRIAPLLERLVARAQDAGAVRPDLEQSDLVFLQAALSSVLHRSRAVEPRLYRRYLAVFLDGIRADGARTPLPVPALDAGRTHRAMTGPRVD